MTHCLITTSHTTFFVHLPWIFYLALAKGKVWHLGWGNPSYQDSLGDKGIESRPVIKFVILSFLKCVLPVIVDVERSPGVVSGQIDAQK